MYLRAGIFGLAFLTFLAVVLALPAFWSERARLQELNTNILPSIDKAITITRLSKSIDSKARNLTNHRDRFGLDGAAYKLRLDTDRLNEVVNGLDPIVVSAERVHLLRDQVTILEESLQQVRDLIELRNEEDNANARNLADLARLSTRVNDALAGVTIETRTNHQLSVFLHHGVNQLLAVLAERSPKNVVALRQEFHAQLARFRGTENDQDLENAVIGHLVREIASLGTGLNNLFDKRLQRIRLDLKVSSAMDRLAILNGLIRTAESISNTLSQAAYETANAHKHQINTLAGGLAVIMVICLLGAIGITLYVDRRIVKRLERLQSAMRAHVEGHPLPVDYQGHDEIADMAQSFVYFVEEVTNREEALAATRDEATQANKAKSEFLASMSHELRTPLNAVLGFAQMLKLDTRAPLSSAQVEHVSSILQGGNHLLSLINEVLDLAKIEADQLDLRIQELDIAREISDCVALTAPLGDYRGIVIENQFDLNPQIRIRTDRLRLKQVLLNLLSNSVKFNKDKGTVTVSGSIIDSQYLRISVVDTGVGIDEKDFSSVFNMFHRLGADPMVAQEGTGIGLTVSKMLVEKMNGRIGFESQIGKGSTFWVDLPLISDTPVENT